MKTITELFEEQAASTPSSVALCFDDERVTYGALNARANQLARYLIRKGAGPETVVGVWLPLGVELVVALLAIAKSGAAYVGRDPTWPIGRFIEVLEDSSAALLIVDGDGSNASDRFRGETIPLRSAAPIAAAERAGNLGIVMTPDHLFSIAYTSGSTGKPKGVMITGRSVVNRMQWMWKTYPFRAGDVALVHRSCASVGFSWDCFGALLKGVPTVIHSGADPRSPVEIVGAAIERGVTHLTAAAGFWDAILDEVERRPGGWPSLRLARTTGEPLRPATVERWRSVFPHVPLLNIYGATECSGSTAFDTSSFQPRGATRVAVGKPVPDVHVFVVDDEMRLLGTGQRGEVCIGGACLARGYLGQPAMTASHFVPSPIDAVPGRVYRTGDLGFWGADGQLELVGRRDLQVKIRGFRVEFEEVESALRECAGITAAAVRVQNEGRGASLVGILESKADSLSAREIRSALLEKLPAYMVPAAFVRVDELPRTARGKIDRRALTELTGQPLEPSASFAAARTASETAVASIWQDALGIVDVGIDDDFFELGGHSLTGIRILARVHDTFGVELPLSVLFDAHTVKTLASEIDRARDPQ